MPDNYEPHTDQTNISAYVVSGFNKAVLVTSTFGLLLGGFLVSVFAH